MTKAGYILLALLAGFAGGMISVRVMGCRAEGGSGGPAETVQARQFILVDQDGERLGSFGLFKGTPGIRLWSKDHRASIWLRASQGMALVDLQGASGARLDLRGSIVSVSLGDTVSGEMHRRLVLEKTSLPDLSGESRVAFYGPDGEFRAGLGLSLDGEPGLSLWNEGRQKCAELSVDDGIPSLRFSDEAGEIRGWFRLRRDGTPSISLWDTLGTLRALLSLDDDEEPSLLLFDGTERTRACIGATSFRNPKTGVLEERAPSSLVLFDETGDMFWSVP